MAKAKLFVFDTEGGRNWVDCFCRGGWKIRNENNTGWIQLTTKNTKIRDEANSMWFDVDCKGALAANAEALGLNAEVTRFEFKPAEELVTKEVVKEPTDGNPAITPEVTFVHRDDSEVAPKSSIDIEISSNAEMTVAGIKCPGVWRYVPYDDHTQTDATSNQKLLFSLLTEPGNGTITDIATGRFGFQTNNVWKHAQTGVKPGWDDITHPLTAVVSWDSSKSNWVGLPWKSSMNLGIQRAYSQLYNDQGSSLGYVNANNQPFPCQHPEFYLWMNDPVTKGQPYTLPKSYYFIDKADYFVSNPANNNPSGMVRITTSNYCELFRSKQISFYNRTWYCLYCDLSLYGPGKLAAISDHIGVSPPTR